MLEKTIKSVLNKKINHWIGTITDDAVRNAIRKDLIITGGCFTSMIQNEPVNDFDCYFRTKETVLLVANYYAKLWNSKRDPGGTVTGIGDYAYLMVLDGANPSEELLKFYDIEKLEDCQSRMIANTPPDRVKMIFPSDGAVGDPEHANNNEELGLFSVNEIVKELDNIPSNELEKTDTPQYFPVFVSTNAITLSNDIQIVVRFYGEPAEIHDTYDYEHTKAFYDYHNSTLSIPQRVYELVTNKTLVYTGSKYPVCSAFRMRKFIERGWKINAGQILKMAMQISELDLMNIDVFEDQLIGVDSLYFMNLIEQFRRSKANNPNFELTPPYVISIIDKIF